MRIQPPLAVLAVLATQADAAGVAPAHSLFSRTSDSISRAHHAAIRHSSNLARDLRTTFKGILNERSQPQPQVQLAANGQGGHVYCAVNSKARTPADTGLGPGSVSNGTTTATSTGKTKATSTKGSKSTSTKSAGATPTGSSDFKVFQQYQGSSFFNGWDFWDLADPTNGVVDFQNAAAAASANLTSINSAGNAIMKVDTTQTVSGNRKAIRITTQATYTGALVILDAVHMPTGCATWPAFWSNGPNWPAGGEIDIVEGVNDYTNNQGTIHTNPGCNLPSADASALGISGAVVGGTNCAAAETSNQGCGVRSADGSSYGAAFNAIGGGVYAMNWDTDAGITIHFFHRDAIPADITAGAPNPSGWGTPMASWPSSACDTNKFFYQHSTIFDTTLCGDWAGGVWGATGIPGQDQSCAQRTGFSDCESFVRASGSDFAEAYWEVKSVTIYQKK